MQSSPCYLNGFFYFKVMNYQEQLKSPKWQKKRLEVFERDSFKCQSCFRTDLQLHAHHKFYLNNLKAWEYKDKVYITLCNKCHNKIHEVNKLLNHPFFLFSERCINSYTICEDAYICKLFFEAVSNKYNSFNDFIFSNEYDKDDIFIYDNVSSITTNNEFSFVIDNIDFENEKLFISKIEIYS